MLYGGIKSTLQMAEALQQLGHDVSVVYPLLPGRDGLPWWNLRKTAVQIVRLIQSLTGKPNWFTFTGNLIAAPFHNERYLPKADVLVLTWWADVARFHSADPSLGKVIHFVRSYETWGGPESKVEQVYSLDIPRVTNSEALARRFTVAPIGVIPNGLDEVFFEDKKPRIQRDTINIGILYRLQDWKRMDDAITVLLDIKKQYPDAGVIVFGETIKPKHRRALSELGDYEYSHLPSGSALRDVYQKIDVFLFTSDETEAFGNPPLEAMAMGCAVVATRVGAIPSYSVDGETALQCNPGDTRAMTTLVKSLLVDTGLRNRLAAAAEQAAQKHRWVYQAEKFQALLTSNLSSADEHA